jgi:zinc transporter ZupT
MTSPANPATWLAGYIPDLPTPFDENGGLDLAAFTKLRERQVQAGVSAILIGETAGEASTLTPAEHDSIVRAAVEIARGRVRIIAGAGSNSTSQAVELTRRAETAGADAVLSVVPYYNKPMQAGIYAHFQAIAGSTTLPIILHDIPSRTARELSNDTMARMTESKQFIGLRDRTGDIARSADRQLADAAKRISHRRAISNLSAGGTDAALWAKVASGSLDHLSRSETREMLTEAANGAGMAIVLGNILDTIPGCLVIGAKFTAFGNLSLTLVLGMFLGGIPEAAASALMLTKAGYRPAAIFGLWSTVLLAGVVAATAGKAFIGSSDALMAIFAQALAGGAVLALVAHAMIPVALEEGGSLVVLPTVAGFLFALYLALAESFV